MGHGKKPKDKTTLTLHFDHPLDRANFIAWYLDGGGEQDAGLYSEAWGKDWLHVRPTEASCPKCRFDDWGDYTDYDKTDSKKLKVHCNNCGHNYEIRNPDPDTY